MKKKSGARNTNGLSPLTQKEAEELQKAGKNVHHFAPDLKGVSIPGPKKSRVAKKGGVSPRRSTAESSKPEPFAEESEVQAREISLDVVHILSSFLPKLGITITDASTGKPMVYQHRISDSIGNSVLLKDTEIADLGKNAFSPKLVIDDGHHILELVKEYALTFNRMGIRIDIETKRKENRVIFSDHEVDLVVHYRSLMNCGMESILHRFVATSPSRQALWREMLPGLDPAELAALSISKKPMINEALDMTPEKWAKSEHLPAVKAGIEKEADRLDRENQMAEDVRSAFRK